jgi:serine/threonine-protein kinase RsbW
MRPAERTVAILRRKTAKRPPPTGVKSLSVANDLAELARVRDFVRGTLRGLPLSEKDIFRIDLAVVEVCVNIVLYAYPERKGTITVSSWREPGRLYYEIRDAGRPFDPRSLKKPDLKEIMRTSRKGGFGVHLSRTMMDGFDYRREDGENILVLSKKLKRKPQRPLATGP